ncbi:MAG: hypothetical protein K1X81_02010 [Bacteroidia bacterium]|nr:hypothetical protein [Bacteroidia bacterium]
MQTLEITKANALAAYQAANEVGKKLLSDLFGEKTFSEKITDMVKTFEDACAIRGVNPNDVLPYASPVNKEQKAINAIAKISFIRSVLNEGWQPDWTNNSEYKYYPFFDMTAGSGLSYFDYDHSLSYSDVGSRLCFKSAELARYAGSQFADIYADFFII